MSLNTPTELRAIADQITQGFHAGQLTLAQIAQLTPAETYAIQRHAEKAWRAGKPKQAIETYGLLLSCDPMNDLHWYRMGQLQERITQPATALSCYLACELLGYDAERARTRQQRCLQKLERADLPGAAANTKTMETELRQ